MNINAFDAGGEVAECLRRGGTLPRFERLLVAALVDVDTASLSAVARHAVVYRLGDVHIEGLPLSHEPWLPFDDRSFDGVVLYRVTSHAVDIQLLLGEASRVLQPEGSLVMLEHQTEFAFAPLPAAGPAHLLHGWLRDAGFAHVDFLPRAGTQVVAVAVAVAHA